MKQNRATQFLCVCGFLGLIQLVVFLGVGIKSSFVQAIPPTSQPDKIAPLPVIKDGYYEAVGDVNGKEYSSLVIIAKQDKCWVVIWLAGTQNQTGCGIMEDGRLIVGYGSEGGIRGVAIYEVGDGKLIGTWSALPTGGKNKETLTFIKGLKK